MSQVRNGSFTEKRSAKACRAACSIGSVSVCQNLGLKMSIIVDACVAGKPPTEAGIAAASQRHAVEMQDQSACCGCVF